MFQLASQPMTSGLESAYADDETLVAALQAGDGHAVEYVVAAHAPALYRYAMAQLQDATLAEDVVSEVLTRMIEKIGSYVQSGTRFVAWLFRIARNLITDHYRARYRRPQLSLDSWLTADPGAEPGALDSRLDLLPLREELLAGLAKLTADQREVILLHVVEGWELPEVARLLGRSVPSVKSGYYRGMESLRRVLSRQPGFEPKAAPTAIRSAALPFGAAA
jgi:RNA polymerase sigma factor (sigma-70 family)